MKIIDLITKWAKRSPIAALITLGVGTLTTINGLVAMSIGNYFSISSLFEEDSVIAIILREETFSIQNTIKLQSALEIQLKKPRP